MTSVTELWCLQVKSLKVLRLHQNTSTVIRIIAIHFATESKPSKKKFLLETDGAADLSTFKARMSCGSLCATSSDGLGLLQAFQRVPLTVTKRDTSSRVLEVSTAGQQIDVDIQAVNSQLQEQRLDIEFR